MKWMLRMLCCGLALGSLSGLVGAQPDVWGAEPEIVEVQIAPRGGQAAPRGGQDKFQPPEGAKIVLRVDSAGGMWIGGHFGALDDLVKSQLNLEHGLAALHIVPDSPAAKAGLQVNDILLTFDGQPVGNVESLMGLIEKTKDKEVEMKVLRRGSEKTFKVRAEKRPANVGVLETDMLKLFNQPLGDVARWFDKDGMRMLLVKPGVVLPQGARQEAEFPRDLRVTVTKDGDRPATITVKRGEKSWEVGEDKLDELPGEIRVFVEPMVQGKGQMRFRLRALVEDEDVEIEGKREDAKDGEEGEGDKKEKRIEVRRRILGVPNGSGIDLSRVESLRKLAGGRDADQKESTQEGAGSTDEIEELRQGLDKLRKEMEQLKKQLRSNIKGEEQ